VGPLAKQIGNIGLAATSYHIERAIPVKMRRHAAREGILAGAGGRSVMPEELRFPGQFGGYGPFAVC
jgi:hypothetical protein